MNFNSAEYLVFLPVVLLLHGLLSGRERGRHWLLLAASYVFYMSWNWQYASLIAFSTFVDYGLGRAMDASEDERRRRALLVVSLTVRLPPAASTSARFSALRSRSPATSSSTSRSVGSVPLLAGSSRRT